MNKEEVPRLTGQLDELNRLETSYIDTIRSLTESLEAAHAMSVKLQRCHMNACNAYDKLEATVKESGEYQKGYEAGMLERSMLNEMQLNAMRSSHAEEVSLLIQTIDELKESLRQYEPARQLAKEYVQSVTDKD